MGGVGGLQIPRPFVGSEHFDFLGIHQGPYHACSPHRAFSRNVADRVVADVCSASRAVSSTQALPSTRSVYRYLRSADASHDPPLYSHAAPQVDISLSYLPPFLRSGIIEKHPVRNLIWFHHRMGDTTSFDRVSQRKGVSHSYSICGTRKIIHKLTSHHELILATGLNMIPTADVGTRLPSSCILELRGPWLAILLRPTPCLDACERGSGFLAHAKAEIRPRKYVESPPPRG